MKQIQKGFTLIELMIVVAIIGILAAVAIPAYQDYIVKAKLSKVSAVADPIKLAIAMYYQEQGSFLNVAGVANAAGAGWTSLGISTFPVATTEVSDISFGACTTCGAADGNPISLKLRNIKATTIDTGTLVMTPTATSTAMTWANTCTGALTDPIAKKYFACP